MIIHGLIKSEKLERQARETNIEATEMIELSRKELNKQKEKAQTALKLLTVRKQGTIENLKNFQDTFQKIIDLGAVIDDGSLNELEELSISTLKGYSSVPHMDVDKVSNKQILATFFLGGGLGGVMIKDAEVALDIANAKWDAAKTLESSNNATKDIYVEIEKLALLQKELISKMNLLFNKSMIAVKDVLSQNGTNIRNYTEYQLQQILICCKCAKILNAMVKTSVMGQEYKLTQQAKKIFGITEKFIDDIGNV